MRIFSKPSHLPIFPLLGDEFIHHNWPKTLDSTDGLFRATQFAFPHNVRKLQSFTSSYYLPFLLDNDCDWKGKRRSPACLASDSSFTALTLFLDGGKSELWSQPVAVYRKGLIVCSPHSIARILDPGNSRENQLDFFSLDHKKWFSISRSRLETWDWKKEILVLISKHEIEGKNFSFLSRKTRFSL